MVPLDALQALIASLRAAGGTLRRQDDALLVRFGRLDAAEREAVTGLLRRHKAAVLALLDAEAVFPGARVVACSVCGGTEWRQAGDRAVRVVCYPAPGRASPPRTESAPPQDGRVMYRDRVAGAHRTRPRGDAEWLSRRKT